jgi:cell surface protein SprA
MADSTEYSVRPTFDVLKDITFDTLSSRRSNYQESYTAGWQPRLSTIDAISFMNYSANYGGGYQWRNSPRGSQLGSNISNNFNLSQSLDFDIRSLLNRMDWYSKLQQKDRQPSQSRTPADTAEAAYSQDKLGQDLLNIGKKSLAAILSIQSIDVSFNISKSSSQSGYAGNSQFFQMFKSSGEKYSPAFSYRTGFTDQIGSSQLIDNPSENSSIQLPSNRNLTDDLTIGSRLQPFDNFSIDLTWNTEWQRTRTKSVTVDPDQNLSSVRTQNGTIRSSVWAFGKGYEQFFRQQLSAAFNDISSGSTVISDSSGNGDGRSVLGRTTMQEDFRRAYLGLGKAGYGSRNFSPFPLPNWRVTWTGLESFIPFLGQYMSRASLSHNYSGLYRLGWVFNSDTSQLPDLSLGSYSVVNRRPEYETNSINVEKRFSPLLGLNITWKSNLRTNLQYEHSKVTSLALSNSTITERISKGLNFSFAYTIRGFKLPFFPRIDNAVDFTINGSYIEDEEKKYELNSDLDQALTEGPDEITKNPEDAEFSGTVTGGQARINGSAVIGYQFSQTIQANFEYNYSKLIPKTSGVYGRTDHDIRFNIVVSITSN